MRALLCAASLLGPMGTASGAGTDFTNLSASEEAVLRAAILDALVAAPHLLPETETTPLQREVIQDRARLERERAALFDPQLAGFGPKDAAQHIAFFTTPDCAPCAQAEAELRHLAQTHDLRVTQHSATSDLARAFGVDTAPFYILPDRLLRGHIPPVVLERYLAE